MWLVAIIWDSTSLEPLLNVLLVFQQNSQLEFTQMVVFMKEGFGLAQMNSAYDKDFLQRNSYFHFSSILFFFWLYSSSFLREPPRSHYSPCPHAFRALTLCLVF